MHDSSSAAIRRLTAIIFLGQENAAKHIAMRRNAYYNQYVKTYGNENGKYAAWERESDEPFGNGKRKILGAAGLALPFADILAKI